MELLIPARDHGSSADRYTWDNNGDVASVQRLVSPPSPSRNPLSSHPITPLPVSPVSPISPQQSQHDHNCSQPQYERKPQLQDKPPVAAAAERPRSFTTSISQQTIQWPFLHHVSGTSSARTSTPLMPVAFSADLSARKRRKTWQARPNTPTPWEKDLIPDYVKNYIRGETPETLARKRQTKLNQQIQPDDDGNEHGDAHPRAGAFWSRGGLGGMAARASGILLNDLEKLAILKSRRTSRFFSPGWRCGVTFNIIIAFLLLLMAVIGLAFAVVTSRMFGGEAIMSVGPCADANRTSLILLGVVNLFGAMVVASANYAFQVLSSPTRPEIDVAHFHFKWLDIGVSSFRNMRSISAWRSFIIGLVLLTATSSLIIYNSVIFTTQTAFPHDVLFVDQSFLTGAPFSNDSATNRAELTRSEIFTLQDIARDTDSIATLTPSQCLASFSRPSQNEFRAVFVVVDTQPSSSSSSSSSPGQGNGGDPTSTTPSANSLLETAPRGSSLAPFSTKSKSLSLNKMPVTSCRAGPRIPSDKQQCQVILNGTLLGALALIHLATVLALGVAATRPRFEPLVTLGDALASFITEPDYSTAGSCLMTKSDIRNGRWGLNEAKYWVPSTHRWIQTPSLRRWLIWLVTWLLPTGMAAFFLASCISAGDLLGNAFSHLGTPSQYAPSWVLSSTMPRAVLVLLSGVPHILLIALYISTNGLLTTYFLSHEFSLFALVGRSGSSGTRARPLRVSTGRPVGAQTASLYLTLPRPYSWLLLFLFTAAGFFLAVAIVPVSAVSSASTDDTDPSTILTAAISLNAAGLVGFLSMLLLIAAVVLIPGILRTADPSPTIMASMAGGVGPDGINPAIAALAPEPQHTATLTSGRVPGRHGAGNPLVLRGGSCSAVISARCHGYIDEESVHSELFGTKTTDVDVIADKHVSTNGSDGLAGSDASGIFPYQDTLMQQHRRRRRGVSEAGAWGMQQQQQQQFPFPPARIDAAAAEMVAGPLAWGVTRPGTGMEVGRAGFAPGSSAGRLVVGSNYA